MQAIEASTGRARRVASPQATAKGASSVAAAPAPYHSVKVVWKTRPWYQARLA